MCDEAQFLSYGFVLVHGGAEVFQVISQPLFLLTDVEFLDVINQFLLQTILIILNIRNLREAVNDASAYLFNTQLFVWFNLIQQVGDVVQLLGELLLQCGTFLFAEVDELVESLCDGLLCDSPFLIIKHFSLGLDGHIGKRE